MSSAAAQPDRYAATDAAGQRALHEKVDLLAALGKALHEVGVPSHRLEEMLVRTARQSGASVQVFSLPTGLMFSVEAEPAPVTLLLRADLGSVHLERMERLLEIVDAIARGGLTASQALQRVEDAVRAPPRWGRVATVVAYVLSAGAFAVFFGGGVPEVITGTLVGLAVGLLNVAMQQVRLSRSLFELSAAAVAAVIANAALVLNESFVEWIPLASGLIVLLPGLALVDAVDELAHGHLSSGSARLAGVGVVLLAMTFGAVLGLLIFDVPPVGAPNTKTTPVGIGGIALALAAVAAGSTIRFRARPVDVWAALAASAIALVGSQLGAVWLGQFAGPFLAAFLLGLAANLYAAIAHQPAQLFTVFGLALLVPGSFGVQSISALLSEETAVGVDTAFHMFLTAMALVTGLLVSNSLYRQVAGAK